MTKAPSIKEALNRIQDQIADLQGEHEVMAGPFDASKWKIEVSIADLQALVATFQPDGERWEAIARIIRKNIAYGHEYAVGVKKATDEILAIASGLVQNEAGIRADERQKCIRDMQRAYPEHAWLNAACATIRSNTGK